MTLLDQGHPFPPVGFSHCPSIPSLAALGWGEAVLRLLPARFITDQAAASINVILKLRSRIKRHLQSHRLGCEIPLDSRYSKQAVIRPRTEATIQSEKDSDVQIGVRSNSRAALRFVGLGVC